MSISIQEHFRRETANNKKGGSGGGGGGGGGGEAEVKKNPPHYDKDHEFSLEFTQNGEVIWFPGSMIKYFTVWKTKRAEEAHQLALRKKKKDFSPSVYDRHYNIKWQGDYERSYKTWRMVFLIYREHDELYNNDTDATKGPIRSETMDRIFPTMTFWELLAVMGIVAPLNAKLLLHEVVTRMIFRHLLPKSVEELYSIHSNVERPPTGNDLTLASTSFREKLFHVVNDAYYKKLAVVGHIFSERGYNIGEHAQTIMSQMPQTDSLIMCSGSHSMVFRVEEGLSAIGSNEYGQFGIDPKIVAYAKSFVRVPLSLKYEIIKVKGSVRHTMFLTTNGLYTCGDNTYGQLALGRTGGIVFEPERVNLENVVDFACSESHSIIITKEGRAYAAGYNLDNQLGLGLGLYNRDSNKSFSFIHDTPTRIPCRDFKDKSDHHFISVACGNGFSLFLTSTGKVFGCGNNTQRQIFLPDDGSIHISLKELDSFKLVKEGRGGGGGDEDDKEDPDDKVVAISCGYRHSAVLTRGGRVFTSGQMSSGQLGRKRIKKFELGENEDAEEEVEEEEEDEQARRCLVRRVRTKVDAPVERAPKMTAIFCGLNSTMMLSEDRVLYACGDNNEGQLGLGVDRNDRNSYDPETRKQLNKFDRNKTRDNNCYYPTRIDLEKVISVSRGGAHSMFLTDEGLYVSGNAGSAMGIEEFNGEDMVNEKRITPTLLLEFGLAPEEDDLAYDMVPDVFEQEDAGVMDGDDDELEYDDDDEKMF